MKTPSLKRNFLYRFAYEALVLALPFVTTPYISRVLGADGVGTYSFTSSIMTYFTMFAALGTASYGAREIAQHRDDPQQASRLFWEIELMTVFTTLVCLLGWGAVIFFGGKYRPYFTALLPMLLGTMFDISWFYTGYEQIQYSVTINMACKLLGVALIFIFVKAPGDLWLYTLINSGMVLLGNMSMWLFLPKLLVRVDFKNINISRHLRETLVYFIPTIATSIYTVLDKTLIGLITHDAFQNGYYEQANKIIRVGYTVAFVAVNSIMSARMSWLFSVKRYDEIRQRIRDSMDFILLMCFGCGFGIVAIARRFVPAFFGGGYEPVVELLYLMAPLVLIVGVSNCLGSHYFTPVGQRKRSAKYIVAGSVVNLICNLLMIPRFGARGAVVASVIAESVISGLYLAKCDGYMSLSMLWRLSWKRLVAGGVMCAAVMLFGFLSPMSNVATVFAQVAIGVIIYAGALLIMRDKLIREFARKAIRNVAGIFNGKGVEDEADASDKD